MTEKPKFVPFGKEEIPKQFDDRNRCCVIDVPPTLDSLARHLKCDSLIIIMKTVQTNLLQTVEPIIIYYTILKVKD